MANQYTLTNDFAAIAETQGTLYNVGDSAIELADADTTPKGQGILLMTGERRTFNGMLYARSMDTAATLNVSDFTDAAGGGDDVADVRRPSTAYTAGALVDGAGLASGLVLRCTTAGTTSSAALDCTGYELGDTITDGTAEWLVTEYVTLDEAGGISPRVSGTVDLGSASRLWRRLYLTLTGKAELGIGYHRRARKSFALTDLEAAVASGKYNEYDIEPGDYYVGASGYTYVFVGDNPMRGTYTGYPIEADHAGLIVDTHETCKWNDANDTTGGYVSSKLHAYLVNTVLPKVKTDLGGVGHLYAHRKLYSTSINKTGYNRCGTATGCSNNWAWSENQYIAALSEVQVYGSIVWSSSGYDTGEADQQLEVFRRFKHTEIFGNEYPWLRDVASATKACDASSDGIAYYHGASDPLMSPGLLLSIDRRDNMKIYDTSGKELTERPDYSKGRLLQDPNDPEKYVYTTWDEIPAGQGNGEEMP